MNENVENVVETTTDSFLDGFGSDAIEVVTETAVSADEVSKEQPIEETNRNEVLEESKQEEVPAEETPIEQPKEEPSMSWNIKVLGESKVVNSKDITVDMLQKAYDYDRIHAKYDESKPIVEMMKTFAEKANMPLQDYVNYIRTEAKKSQGMTEEEAKRTINLEDREAIIATKEAEHKEIESQAEAEKQRQADLDAKTKESLDEFARAFPDIYKQAKENPNIIPQEVWDAINKENISLTAAYSKWYVDNATHKLQVMEKNAENSARSTGSMKSSGNDLNVRDAFLNDWD